MFFKKRVMTPWALAILASLSTLSQMPSLRADDCIEEHNCPICPSCEKDSNACACIPQVTTEDLPCPQDTVPVVNVCGDDGRYFQGYIQALIDMNYYEQCVKVAIEDGVVYLYNLPNNPALCKSVVYFVENIPGVSCVRKGLPPSQVAKLCTERPLDLAPPCHSKGIWLPQQTILFGTLLADPRQTMYSGAYRLGDQVIGHQVGAVSFGEDFPIYRWRNVGSKRGDVQIGIEGCVFGVFDLTDLDHTELVNTDFFVSIPVTWAYDRFSWRFRIYHISSHLGDEFLVDNPGYTRYNLSYEAVDAFISYQWNSAVRFYFGAGYIVHYDPEFPLKRPYIQYGAEFRFLGRKNFFNSLYMQPFLAFNLENDAYNDWNFDFTSSLGIEWSRIQGVGRKVRISVDYHDGYSPDGQFIKERCEYVQFKLGYGF